MAMVAYSMINVGLDDDVTDTGLTLSYLCNSTEIKTFERPKNTVIHAMGKNKRSFSVIEE